MVYDVTHNVTWLEDANLSASNRFGVPVGTGPGEIPASGAMDFKAAEAWVAGMDGAKYLGHSNWQLPTTPGTDRGCGKTGPHNESFGFGCTASAFGSLYSKGLSLAAPASALLNSTVAVGPLSNLQPYLYWSQTPGGGTADACKSTKDGCGYASFSFVTGFHGDNTAPNFLFVLPSIKGKLPGAAGAPGGSHLQVSSDGQMVYDPQTDRTWLANANLAATNTFGLPRCSIPTEPPLCIAAGGAMTWDSAKQFLANMDVSGYLGQKSWELPPLDSNCPSFSCDGEKNPMGNLFSQLGFAQGKPAATPPDLAAGPFRHLQPYLYWSCQGLAVAAGCGPSGPANNFQWSFSFASGFQGTDILQNNLFVTVYFPGK